MTAVCIGPGGRVEVDNEVGNPLPVTVVGGSITFPASVEIANDVGSPIPVAAAALPLPSGAATDAGLVAIAASLALLLAELGQKLEPGQQVALDAASLAALESITATVANWPSDFPDAATVAKAEAIRALLAATLTVALDAGTLAALETISVANFPATQPVSLATFPAFPELEVKNDAGSPLAVSGPLTDAQLRATPVPVSGTVTATLGEIEVKNDSGNPVPISGTVTANLGTIDGAATESSLDAINGKLSDLSGTWGYAAGANGTVVLSGSKRVIGIAAHATTAGSFTINGGDSIPVPANSSIEIQPIGNLIDPTIVFSADIDSYFIESVV